MSLFSCTHAITSLKVVSSLSSSSSRPLWTYLDVVFGPVDAADRHPQATQAALVHVAGDGAAEAVVAEETVAAWLGGKKTQNLHLACRCNCERAFKEKRKERSQVPQSSQQSNVPVWNSVCWTRPGCMVTGMMEVILWGRKKWCFVLISVLWAPFWDHYMCVFLQQR